MLYIRLNHIFYLLGFLDDLLILSYIVAVYENLNHKSLYINSKQILKMRTQFFIVIEKFINFPPNFDHEINSVFVYNDFGK